jgi:hypothetical protein
MKAFLPDCLTSLSKLALVNSTAEPLTASADATRSSVRMSDVEVVTCALLLHCERVFLLPPPDALYYFLDVGRIPTEPVSPCPSGDSLRAEGRTFGERKT